MWKILECPLNVSLDSLPKDKLDTTMSGSSYYIYHAVDVVAWALPEMLFMKAEVLSIMDTGQLMFLP